MPKYGIHFIVLDRVIADLEQKANGVGPDQARAAELFDILSTNRFQANLGAIGPDLLFWAPDYKIVSSLMDLVAAYDTVEPLIDAVRDLATAIKTNIDATVDSIKLALESVPFIGPVIRDIDDWHTIIVKIKDSYQELFSQMKSQFLEDVVIKITGLDGSFENITLARSLLQGLFQASNQAGREEMEWYWFDMLHYRKTGDYAKELVTLAEASGDDSLKAYAYAYLTHYATDLVGHPYVNTISGAPYRIAVQRHVVIENYMDQWKWHRTYSRTEEDGAITGENIRNDLFSAFEFEDVQQLPDSLAGMIRDALKNTYAKVVHPIHYLSDDPHGHNPINRPLDLAEDGFLSAEDIKIAYSFQRHFLEFFGGKKKRIKPEEPFPGADAFIAQMQADGSMFTPPPSLPATPGAVDVNNIIMAIDVWFQALVDYARWVADTANAVANLIGDVAAMVASGGNPDDDAKMALQALAYWLELLAYDFYRTLNQVMALAGFGYPEPEDTALPGDNSDVMIVNLNPIAEKLITVGACGENKKEGFPVLKFPGQPHLDCRSYKEIMTNVQQSNINRSFTRFENPITRPSFYAFGSTPDVFISETPLDLDLLQQYAAAKTPEETRDIQSTRSRSFGNAIDISVELMLRSLDSGAEEWVYCNWNLDGDRGYGYKTWDGIPFTVIPDEIGGVLDRADTERAEYVTQNFSVWTFANTVIDPAGNRSSEYISERYVGIKGNLDGTPSLDDKTFDDTIIATLNISEVTIPNIFTEAPYWDNSQEWVDIVPQRLKVNSESLLQNFVFINGLATTPSAGMRSKMVLERALKDAYGNDQFDIRFLHNYSSLDVGDMHLLFDLKEGILDDYLYGINATAAISNGFGPASLPRIANPTQIAIMALLHHGMVNDIPLMISAHSQGAIISGNAILAFSSVGQPQRDYLMSKVRLFHMEPEILKSVRKLIQSLLSKYLVYIVNQGDGIAGANGLPASDILPELLSGDAPGLPLLPSALVTQSPNTTNFINTISSPDLLDVQFYVDLLAEVGSGGNDLLMAISTMLSMDNMDLKVHFLPNQMMLLTRDIQQKHFRTDPAFITGYNQNTHLSTTAPIPGAHSVNVNEFFLD